MAAPPPCARRRLCRAHAGALRPPRRRRPRTGVRRTPRARPTCCAATASTRSRRRAALLHLPEAPAVETARSYALLAGLWGYRAAQTSVLRMPSYGRRTIDLLRRAKRARPRRAVRAARRRAVACISAGALRRRPAAALARFRRLSGVLGTRTATGIAPLEADLWVWYTLDRSGDAAAPAMRARLLAGRAAALPRFSAASAGLRGRRDSRMSLQRRGPSGSAGRCRD